MIEIEAKIMEYGQSKEKEQLQTYIAGIGTTELLEVLKRRIYNSSGVSLWNYTMQGFVNTEQSHKKRYKIVSNVLQEIENNQLIASQLNQIITRLCIELSKFKNEHLVRLAAYCSEQIQKGNGAPTCWKDLLPKILIVMLEREHVDYNDTVMTGIEYITKVIDALCALSWSPNILTSLTAMFIDMPLSKEDHFLVVNKLGQCMEKLTCQEVPAFVHQMLQLCQKEHSKSLFLRMQYYFGTRVYSNKNLLIESNSEGSDLDAIGSAQDMDILQVESTVLYHIHQSASDGHNSIKEFLNSLKTLSKSPEFVLHPFNITALLTISTVPYYEETVLEILRISIATFFSEEYRKNESCWSRDMIPELTKLETVFQQIIEFSVSERPLVVEGLVRLAFVIMGAGVGLSKESAVIAGNQIDLGNLILVKVVKRKRYISGSVVEMLNDKIMTRPKASQYIDCLHSLCRHMPLVMLECQSSIVVLLECLLQLPGGVAMQLLEAIMPLIKISPTTRDHLILLLRKALYTRVTETRQMAVIGFLKLLKHMKVTNLAALSQSSGTSSSTHSYLTQISMESRSIQAGVFSNEALCLEVLGILKRCFMQQSEVRAQLYEGLYDAVCTNPELGIPVLDVLWNHFSQYYVNDGDSLPPLLFSKISVVKDFQAVMEEPMSKLIYAIGLIVTKVLENDDSNETVTRFLKIFDSLCDRMTQCELIHFELDDGTDLLDVLPESQTKLLILKEAMGVYEALIGYKICSWGPDSENYSQQINNLFRCYSRLQEFSKNLSRPKKADKEGKRKGDKSTQSSKNSPTKSTQSSSKSSFTKPNTILDLQVLGKILNLLHRPQVTWTNTAHASVIRIKPEFHRYVMECTMQQVDFVNQNRVIERKEQTTNISYITEIGALLYERCIQRLEEFIDFDCQTALMALECFQQIFSLMSKHYKSDLKKYLVDIGNVDDDKNVEQHLAPLVEVYRTFLTLNFDELGEKNDVKKMPIIVVSTLVLFSTQIPDHGLQSLSAKLLDWLKSFTEEQIVSNKVLANAILSLMFNLHLQCKSSITFFENIANQLVDIYGAIDNNKPNVATEYKIINDSTNSNALQLLCNSVKSMLDDVDWVIARLRSEYVMINYPGEDSPERRREILKDKERGVCCQMCQIVLIISTLCNTIIPVGSLTDTLMKNVTHFYNSLTALTKYFTSRSTKVLVAFQQARFERLVKLAGKRLTAIVYEFIMHMEESQKQENETQENASGGNKKKVDSNVAKSKVLRERRVIPKVVYEMEQFGKCIMQLSTKTKCDLSKLVGQGTVRDFRLMELKETLELNNPHNNSDIDEQSAMRNDDSMDVDEENKSASDKENLSDDEASAPPPRKRAKKSKT